MQVQKNIENILLESKELFFKEEKTKIGTIFLKNPDDPYRPTRIIGVPFSVAGLWSWKNIYRIHISDPAAAPVVDDAPVYASAESRLANYTRRIIK